MGYSRALVESTIGYTFSDNHNIDEAMEPNRNRRLTFLGGRVVALMLIDLWYRSETSCGMIYTVFDTLDQLVSWRLGHRDFKYPSGLDILVLPYYNRSKNNMNKLLSN
jgi:hypothetical protein